MTRDPSKKMSSPILSHHNKDAKSGLLLVCEHASNFIPSEFENLGLSGDVLQSHIAWDIGAAAFAKKLANRLDATLIQAEISRLVYDCNRPPDAHDAMPEKSEIFDIPGNLCLDTSERQYRITSIYEPFKNCVSDLAKVSTALITIHSFTPVFLGQLRDVEIGVLHDTDSYLADHILKMATRHLNLNIKRNQPYSPEDGVTHTLKMHGVGNQLPNVMLEIRNDILSDPLRESDLLEQLVNLLGRVLKDLNLLRKEAVRLC